MTIKENKPDKRFKVILVEDLPEELKEDYEHYDEWTSALVDTKNNEVIYVDNEDCPEDKYLFRDLRIFVDKLNEVDAE